MEMMVEEISVVLLPVTETDSNFCPETARMLSKLFYIVPCQLWNSNTISYYSLKVPIAVCIQCLQTNCNVPQT